jgi:hypothetical protein
MHAFRAPYRTQLLPCRSSLVVPLAVNVYLAGIAVYIKIILDDRLPVKKFWLSAIVTDMFHGVVCCCIRSSLEIETRLTDFIQANVSVAESGL